MTTRRGFSLLPVPLALTAAAAGLAIGLGAFAFHYAKGTSYLGNDPATCANCHVMQGHYDAWLAGPHHQAATCNDCHTPAGSVGKYRSRRRTATTTRRPSRSAATPTSSGPGRRARGRRGQLPPLPRRPRRLDARGGDVSCIRCHASVGHQR